MHLIKKALVVLGYFSVIGVLLGLTLWTVAFYTSGASVYWRTGSMGEFYSIYQPFGNSPIGHTLWGYVEGPVTLWMLGGAVGVFIFGFYFAFNAKTPIQRVLMALCFLCVWVGVVVCYIPGLIEWFLD